MAPIWIDEAGFLKLLREGVARSNDMIALITDYHGGPVTTEYMLTSDIARELIHQNHEVHVEYLNRRMVNGMTMRRSGPPVPKFGSRRTDVAVLKDQIIPRAIVEVKIGVKTLRGILEDLEKITDTIGAMKPQYAVNVWGAAVFQVHIAGGPRRYTEQHLRDAVEQVERTLQTQLKAYASLKNGFQFSFHPLQSDDAGIVPQELEPDGDGMAWGRHGHATRNYAVLIQSTELQPGPARTFEDLKALSRS